MSLLLSDLINENSFPLFLAIGGGMELSKNSHLVQTFIKYSGGKKGKITILPTASDHGDEVGSLYEECFKEFCDDVKFFLIDAREDADDPRICERLKSSTGIFFTGGNQLRITSLLGGSDLLKIVKDRSNEGVIIAGTSAGASAMSSAMISWGDSDKMVKGNLQMSAGLGFIQDLVIDSHFVKRGRISRLFHLVSDNPGVLGIGLAEDTGILYVKNDEYPVFEVIGTRQVIVVNGKDIKHTNIAQIPENLPYSVTDVNVSVLGPQYIYNIDTREISIPEGQFEEDPFVKAHEVSDLPYKPKNK